MEYIFKNSFAEKACTIVLSEYNLTMKGDGKEVTIPYAGIVAVQLARVTDRVFKTYLYADNHKPILITNRFYTAEKRFEDRSRAYSTFVRVLHFHLKDKSKAQFSSGSRTSKIWVVALVSVAASFILSFIADFLGVGIVNPFLQGGILATVLCAVVLITFMNHWPKGYAPTDIPLEFLP